MVVLVERTAEGRWDGGMVGWWVGGGEGKQGGVRGEEKWKEGGERKREGATHS